MANATPMLMSTEPMAFDNLGALFFAYHDTSILAGDEADLKFKNKTFKDYKIKI